MVLITSCVTLQESIIQLYIYDLCAYERGYNSVKVLICQVNDVMFMNIVLVSKPSVF